MLWRSRRKWKNFRDTMVKTASQRGFRTILWACSIAMLMILSVNLASATISDFGSFKQGESINLIQICATCTSVNITGILYPNSSVAASGSEMTASDGIYNYTFDKTQPLGKYLVNGVGDTGGVNTEWNYEFIVTKSGEDYSDFDFQPIIISLFGIIIILLILAYLLAENHEIVSAIFAGIGFYLLLPLIATVNIVFSNNFFNPGITGMLDTIIQIFTWMDYALIIYIVVYTFVKVISGYNQDKKAKIEGLS